MFHLGRSKRSKFDNRSGLTIDFLLVWKSEESVWTWRHLAQRDNLSHIAVSHGVEISSRRKTDPRCHAPCSNDDEWTSLWSSTVRGGSGIKWISCLVIRSEKGCNVLFASAFSGSTNSMSKPNIDPSSKYLELAGMNDARPNFRRSSPNSTTRAIGRLYWLNSLYY